MARGSKKSVYGETLGYTGCHTQGNKDSEQVFVGPKCLRHTDIRGISPVKR